MAGFMGGDFPPGLLNPGADAGAAYLTEGPGAWCYRFLGVGCSNWKELLLNLFLTSRGVWLLLPMSLVILLLYRLVGPPEVDEREEQLRQQWADHRKRFKSGAKRASLKGVIKSSYLTELGGDPRGRFPPKLTPPSDGTPAAPAATAVDASPRSSEDDGWEEVAGADAAVASVAATEAAPSVQRPPPPRETVYVLTTPGPTRVTIVGDRSGSGGGCGDRGSSRSRRRVSVLTLHAAGHNHRTCLGALEREAAKDEELGVAAGGGSGGGGGGVVFYHVDTPGHEEEKGDELEATALSLEAQAAQLLQVVIQLELGWFVGLGVGAGANVLLRFACDNPDRVAGLILANGSAEEAGRRERNAWLAPRFRLSWEKDMKAARESLVPLSLPPHSSLASRYRAALGTMHAGNVLKYVDASLCRDDIPASRLQAISDVWTLLLYGTEPPEASSSGVGGFLSSFVAGVDAESAARSLLDKLRRAAAGAAGGGSWESKATVVTLPGGGKGGGLLEAKPREALAAIKLFLNKCL